MSRKTNGGCGSVREKSLTSFEMTNAYIVVIQSKAKNLSRFEGSWRIENNHYQMAGIRLIIDHVAEKD
jgi:hypothetical protein